MMSNTWIISKNAMEMGKSPKVLPALLIRKMLGCFVSFLDFFIKQLYISLDH